MAFEKFPFDRLTNARNETLLLDVRPPVNVLWASSIAIK